MPRMMPFTVSEVMDACPRCGASAILYTARWESGKIEYFVECAGGGSCARTDYKDTMEDAINAWNEHEMV